MNSDGEMESEGEGLDSARTERGEKTTEADVPGDSPTEDVEEELEEGPNDKACYRDVHVPAAAPPSRPLGLLFTALAATFAIFAAGLLMQATYRRMPTCASFSSAARAVCFTECEKLVHSACDHGNKLALSAGTVWDEVVNRAATILLPLPPQPGTEMYWDVRFRRALRQLVAPLSLKSKAISISDLLVPCRVLPLQTACGLHGPWGTARMNWHLTSVLKVLSLIRRKEGKHKGKAYGERGSGTGHKRGKRVGGLGVRAGQRYDQLCQRQFGAGAYFDGELCSCKKGYIVKGESCIERPKRGGTGAGGDARRSKVDSAGGGAKSRGKRGGRSNGQSAGNATVRGDKSDGGGGGSNGGGGGRKDAATSSRTGSAGGTGKAGGGKRKNGKDSKQRGSKASIGAVEL